MALNYPVQPGQYIFGTDSTTVTLSDSYNDNQRAFPIGGMSEIKVYVQYTPDQSSRSIYIQIEDGLEEDDLYLRSTIQPSFNDIEVATPPYIFPDSGSSTTGSQTYKFSLSIPVASKHFRISIKEDGSSNFGTAKVRVEYSGK